MSGSRKGGQSGNGKGTASKRSVIAASARGGVSR